MCTELILHASGPEFKYHYHKIIFSWFLRFFSYTFVSKCNMTGRDSICMLVISSSKPTKNIFYRFLMFCYVDLYLIFKTSFKL